MKPTHRFVVVTSSLLAIAVALALFLRPKRTGPELAAPERLSAPVRAVIKSKMLHHGEQLGALVTRVVVLDYDGIARSAGEIFDEPSLARPLTGEELNAELPERFFRLQSELRVQARQLVDVAARRDGPRLTEVFGSLVKTCVGCHDLYLRGE